MKLNFALACASIAVTVVSAATSNQDWSYKPTADGVYGPFDWNKVMGSKCGGTRQSPIDIVQTRSPMDIAQTESRTTVQTAPLVFAGTCDNYNVTQQYEGFKNEPFQSTCTVTVQSQDQNQQSYSYLQSHLHLPSEHTLNGRQFDGELHLVHKSDSGLLVIGLFFQESSTAPTTPLISNLLAGLDKVTPDTFATLTLGSYGPVVQSSLNAGRVFNYPGSLTTPDCSETVDWWVIETPVPIQANDLASLRQQLQRVEALDQWRGARPVQPLNGRTISVYSS